MGFLGGSPLSVIKDELETSSERFQPTMGLAASTAFEETRSLFGFKPLQDLSTIATMRGYEGGEAFGVNDGAVEMMLGNEIEGTPTSRMMEPDEANKEFGIENHLKFTVPISINEAKFKRKRKIEEIDRNYILQQNKGFMRNLATFGIEFVADITDPIGLATLLFPVTSYRTVSKLTKEIGKISPYAVGMGEAAIGIAVPLTPGYFASQEFQYSFTPADYGISLIGGVAIGGAIRKLLYMRDTTKLLQTTQAELDNFEAGSAAIDMDIRNQGELIDDVHIDHAAERTIEENGKAREHASVQQVEGKFDTEWMDSYIELNDSLHTLGRTPMDGRIESFSDNIAKLDENLTQLKELLKTVPDGPHGKRVKKLIAQTEAYIKLNKKQKKKLLKQKKDRLKHQTTDMSPGDKEIDPKLAEQQALDEAKEISKIEYEITGKNSTTRKHHRGGDPGRARKSLIKVIKKILGDDFSEILDNTKLKDAFKILKGVIEKEGALTAKNIVRALQKENIDQSKAKKILEKSANRYEKPSNEEMSSGDLKAIDYQQDLDLQPNQREEHDIKDDFNNDTEWGYRTTDNVGIAADDEHDAIASLIESMEKNVKSEENPRGAYSESEIANIKERWESGEFDDAKTENALVDYDQCVRRPKQ
jgi:hypothetical protein